MEILFTESFFFGWGQQQPVSAEMEKNNGPNFYFLSWLPMITNSCPRFSRNWNKIEFFLSFILEDIIIEENIVKVCLRNAVIFSVRRWLHRLGRVANVLSNDENTNEDTRWKNDDKYIYNLGNLPGLVTPGWVVRRWAAGRSKEHGGSETQ